MAQTRGDWVLMRGAVSCNAVSLLLAAAVLEEVSCLRSYGGI
jgi:hypothetical protein